MSRPRRVQSLLVPGHGDDDTIHIGMLECTESSFSTLCGYCDVDTEETFSEPNCKSCLAIMKYIKSIRWPK